MTKSLSVLKNEETRFYGGKSNPLEKRTRVRSRMVSQALENLIAEADQVMVMGHQYPDMDCIGGCLGIRRIAKMHGKNLMDCDKSRAIFA